MELESTVLIDGHCLIVFLLMMEVEPDSPLENRSTSQPITDSSILLQR